MASGASLFVSSSTGSDDNDGSEKSPWKTIQHAVKHLNPGHTLYLRQGTYYENVYVAVSGTDGAPITIRSFPGEQAVIDGGIQEFFDEPSNAWTPFTGGGKGEYRSTRPHGNLREALGWFGDSMIGLNTYYHVEDLRASNEVWKWKDPTKRRETDCEPMYCGPGVWYDQQTGHIHIRLSHTNLEGTTNYKGETDPRKLPLVITAFNSVPLYVDGAHHVRFQDLVIRGGGYDTVKMFSARNIEFDNVTVWCGTYGMRTRNTIGLVFYRSALYGSCPPWLFRSDTSLRAYPGRPHRNITRLNTHSNWIVDAGREFSVYAIPMNDDWEVSYSEFTDGHDGPYFGGVNIKFHHNLVEHFEDDGIYLSQMYPRHAYMRGGAEIHIYQNLFRRCLTALAFGGMEDTKDTVYVYRNIFDMRGGVPTGRPTAERNTAIFAPGKIAGDHGSPPWPTMFYYHNTFLLKGRYGGVGGHTHPDRPRSVFNNIFIHDERLPSLEAPLAGHGKGDGNLYWSPKSDEKSSAGFFNRYRSKNLEASKAAYPPGTTANSFIKEPRLHTYKPGTDEAQDYRLSNGSAAIDAGVVLPAEWPDPLRASDAGKPDIGALPSGTEQLKVGRTSAPPIK